MKLSRLVAACAAAAALSTSVAALAKVENTKGSTKNAEIPTCGRSLGTIALVDGDGQGWKAFQLGAPSTLLKTFVSKSGCFKLVNRGAGMDAIRREQELSGGGDLQRGSNVGGGQIKAADWLLVADLAGQNSNSGGSAVGAIAGGMLGNRYGGLGALAGGIKTNKVEAQTVLSLVNARTSEEEYNIEGMWWEVEDENGNVGWVLNDKLTPKK